MIKLIDALLYYKFSGNGNRIEFMYFGRSMFVIANFVDRV